MITVLVRRGKFGGRSTGRKLVTTDPEISVIQVLAKVRKHPRPLPEAGRRQGGARASGEAGPS